MTEGKVTEILTFCVIPTVVGQFCNPSIRIDPAFNGNSIVLFPQVAAFAEKRGMPRYMTLKAIVPLETTLFIVPTAFKNAACPAEGGSGTIEIEEIFIAGEPQSEASPFATPTKRDTTAANLDKFNIF